MSVEYPILRTALPSRKRLETQRKRAEVKVQQREEAKHFPAPSRGPNDAFPTLIMAPGFFAEDIIPLSPVEFDYEETQLPRSVATVFPNF